LPVADLPLGVSPNCQSLFCPIARHSIVSPNCQSLFRPFATPRFAGGLGPPALAAGW
jgi:hypothetical protein